MIKAYSESVVTMVGDALADLINDISSIDNIILPMTDLIFDSAVILAKHSPRATDEMLFLQQLIETNPHIYSASAQRMQRRLNNIMAAEAFVQDGISSERVRSLAIMGTTLYVPGKIFTSARAVIKNLRALTASTPRFHADNADAHWLNLKSIEKLSYEQIRAIRGEKELMYIITQERELVIAEQTYDHWPLSRGEPIYAEGVLYIKDGRITRIDNKAGRFENSGQYLDRIVEKAFKRNGFTEVPGQFADFQEQYESYLHRDYDIFSHSPRRSSAYSMWFDADSLDGMIFGIYLLKNHPLNNPRFPLSDSLDFKFSCQKLSWPQIRCYNNAALMEAGQPTNDEFSFFAVVARRFAEIKLDFDTVRPNANQVAAPLPTVAPTPIPAVQPKVQPKPIPIPQPKIVPKPIPTPKSKPAEKSIPASKPKVIPKPKPIPVPNSQLSRIHAKIDTSKNGFDTMNKIREREEAAKKLRAKRAADEKAKRESMQKRLTEEWKSGKAFINHLRRSETATLRSSIKINSTSSNNNSTRNNSGISRRPMVTTSPLPPLAKPSSPTRTSYSSCISYSNNRALCYDHAGVPHMINVRR